MNFNIRRIEIMIILCMLLVALAHSQQLNGTNLFCNGTFEGYTTSDLFGEYILNLPYSNQSCWYEKTRQQRWQVKTTPLFSNAADLNVMIEEKITLCQSFQLYKDSQYQLNLSMITVKNMKSANLFIYANQVKIYSKSSTKQNIRINISTTFTAFSQETEVCFNDTHSFKPASIITQFLNSCQGVLIDDLSLVIIPKTIQDVIQMEINIQQVEKRIILITNYTVPNQMALEFIIKKIKVYIESETNPNYTTFIDSNNKLSLNIYPLKNYNMTDVKISIESENPDEPFLLKFKTVVHERQNLFQKLSDSQIKMLKYIDPLGVKLVNLVRIGYKVISVSFCSYFILNILNFWNLSLLYNFLNIHINPVFSREFLQSLAQILYSQNSFISWICYVFSWNPNAFDFKHRYDRELIDKNRNYFQWFGSMSFTSNVISNNIQTFLLLALLIVKLILLNLIQNCINPKFRKFLLPKQKFKIVFLKQFIAFQPLVIISAASCTLSLSYINYSQVFNNIAQIVFLGICLFVVPILYIYSTQKVNKKKSMRSIKLIKSIGSIGSIGSSRGKNNIQMTNQVLEYCLSISIPILIVMDTPSVFLIVNSMIIFLKAYHFFKFIKSVSKWEGFFGAIMNLIWVTHTVTYSLLFTIEKIVYMGYSIHEVYAIARYCGFITIGTILLGGAVEIVKLILEIMIFLGKAPRKIFRLLFSNSIQPQQDKKGKHESKKRKKETKKGMKSSKDHQQLQKTRTNLQVSVYISKQAPQKKQEKGNTIYKSNMRGTVF